MFVPPHVHRKKKVGKYPIKKIRTLTLVDQAAAKTRCQQLETGE